MKMIVDSIKICLLISILSFFIAMAGCETKKTGAGEQAKKKEEQKDSTCSLLSKEDVEAVLKQKLKEPKIDDILCIYETVQSSPSMALVVQLNPVEPEMFLQNKTDFMKASKTFKPAEGVGDNAYFNNGQLNVLAKKRELSFRIEGDGVSEEDLIKLARKAVERIH